MCDYSLHFVASRPARVGDKLFSTRFRASATRGFAAIDQAEIAVCLLPGTEVAFERDVECDGLFGFFQGRSLKQKLARFRQINLDQPTMLAQLRDQNNFSIGKLKRQHATVLQLPALERAPCEAVTNERVPVSTMA